VTDGEREAEEWGEVDSLLTAYARLVDQAGQQSLSVESAREYIAELLLLGPPGGLYGYNTEPAVPRLSSSELEDLRTECLDLEEAGGVEQFELEVEEEMDDAVRKSANISSTDVLRGMDMQGIPWHSLQFRRSVYRSERLATFDSFRNLTTPLSELDPLVQPVAMESGFFRFTHTHRRVHCTYAHFQLRRLLWCTGSNSLYYMQNHALHHYYVPTGRVRTVMDLRGNAFAVGRTTVGTMAVGHGLCVAGGFRGQVVATRLGDGSTAFARRVSLAEDAIVNHLDVLPDSQGTVCIYSSCNDEFVRVLNAESGATMLQTKYDWCVNATALSPDGRILAVTGDSCSSLLVEASSGVKIASLPGHRDYNFSCCWVAGSSSPLVATGGQDRCVLMYDPRFTSQPLFALRGKMGAVRSITPSPDGRYLVVGESADFARVYDVGKQCQTAQEIDFFGELCGVAISPDSQRLFLGLADPTYGGILEYKIGDGNPLCSLNL